MIIYVVSISGKKYNIEVDIHENIYSIKQKITENEDFHASEIRICCDGRELTDEWTLAEYNIQQGTTLYSVLKLGFIKNRTNPNIINLTSDTLIEKKNYICIKTSSIVYRFIVNGVVTVEEIKAKILDLMGLQRFVNINLSLNDFPLENDRNLSSYNIQDNARLILTKS